ncbi:hemolysin family protein [Paenibacillus koleovorans]|uniref:hemolysin family protein n=1 Tax=Paenibacillus koleovorans TaxID=121608 RepID=UPI00248234E6|nr:hemolysin family protein [Paenibacillus koleovorans]
MVDPDPEPGIWLLKLAAVLTLVLLNGFFVAVEFAMIKVRGSRIDALVQEGNMRAKFARLVVNNLNAYLSACQLGITLASLALGWIGEPFVNQLIGPALARIGTPEAMIHMISFLIAFTVITALHITIGEQVPKTYAIRKAEQVTLWGAAPLIVFYKLMYPLIWSLNGTSNWMLRKSGMEPDEGHESVHTEEEIRILMKESHKNGYIDHTELALVDNIFEFSETSAREIMIPRTEMVCLYANFPYEANRAIAISEMHTRYPICDPDKDNIIGFIHIKDLLKSDDRLDDVKPIMRPLLSVPESISISSLLKHMQKRRTAIALLIDEYGGTSGLVTLEDILEEIVGEIHDEFDDERPKIERKDEATHSVDGMLLIEEFNDLFGTELETQACDTIGGWVYSRIEIPPTRNQRVICGELALIVEEVDHMRIARLLVRRLPGEEAHGERQQVS